MDNPALLANAASAAFSASASSESGSPHSRAGFAPREREGGGWRADFFKAAAPADVALCATQSQQYSSIAPWRDFRCRANARACGERSRAMSARPPRSLRVMDRNHPHTGSQSFGSLAHIDCNWKSGSGSRSLRLGSFAIAPGSQSSASGSRSVRLKLEAMTGQSAGLHNDKAFDVSEQIVRRTSRSEGILWQETRCF